MQIPDRSGDPAGLEGGENAHEFCDDNPLTNADPSGLQSDSTLSIWQQLARYFGSENYSSNEAMGQHFFTVVIPHAAVQVAARGAHVGLIATQFLSVAVGDPEIAGAEELLEASVGGGLDGAQESAALATSVSPEISTGTNSVYQAITSTGTVKYVGITNNFIRRAAEHAGDLKGLTLSPIKGLGALSRYDARAVEQVLIEKFGGAKGAQLINKINCISSTSKIYKKSFERVVHLLRSVGYPGIG